jgi:hypothetical protein
MTKQKLGPNQLKWIEALESGEFQQTRRLMCVSGKYCCLGVARKVLNLKNTTKYSLGLSFGELGLRSSDGRANVLGADSLVALNDIEGLSFKEIATVLREDPSMYFTEPK